MDLEKVSEDVIETSSNAEHEDIVLTKGHSSIAVVKPASVLVRNAHWMNRRNKLLALALLSFNQEKCLEIFTLNMFKFIALRFSYLEQG